MAMDLRLNQRASVHQVSWKHRMFHEKPLGCLAQVGERNREVIK